MKMGHHIHVSPVLKEGLWEWAEVGRWDGDGSHIHPSHTTRAGWWDGGRILHLPWETQPSLGTSLIAGGAHAAFWQLRLL